jgi:hypothetical protein
MDRPALYRIRVMGHLDPAWSEWFDRLTVSRGASGQTEIHGMVADQAALHGLLARIRDLGLPLIAVELGSGSSAERDTHR